MVGNDIIDIKETKETTNWKRPGSIQKIFSPDEQEMISNASDPFSIIWHLWSMKESAYKVFIQTGGKRFFNPSKIECSLDSLCNGYVRINQATYCTSTSINRDYISTVATLDNTAATTSIFQLPDKNAKLQSSFMHQQVLNDFATMQDLNIQDLKIKKRDSGAPIIIHHKKPLNIALSISHHGNYGAYSILKLNQ